MGEFDGCREFDGRPKCGFLFDKGLWCGIVVVWEKTNMKDLQTTTTIIREAVRMKIHEDEQGTWIEAKRNYGRGIMTEYLHSHDKRLFQICQRVSEPGVCILDIVKREREFPLNSMVTL